MNKTKKVPKEKILFFKSTEARRQVDAAKCIDYNTISCNGVQTITIRLHSDENGYVNIFPNMLPTLTVRDKNYFNTSCHRLSIP